MKWKKLGLVYAPSGDAWWAKNYTHIPTAEIIDTKRIRVYFASLDDKKYGRIGFVDVDIENPTHILDIAKEPILDLGPIGSFDDCGVTPSCVVSVDKKKYLYYIGWQRCERVPYMLFTGLALNDKNATTFKKLRRTPILDRTDKEPFSRSAPCIIYDNNQWKMWYWTCVEWTAADQQVHYNNIIKYATSDNGIDWVSEDEPCLMPNFKNEYSVGRPWVIHENNIYKMWYSNRSFDELYTIGYAESVDGKKWHRMDDKAGISKSAQGWDSEMICYPCVINLKDKKYLFYNGNKHGATGFGCAVSGVD